MEVFGRDSETENLFDDNKAIERRMEKHLNEIKSNLKGNSLSSFKKLFKKFLSDRNNERDWKKVSSITNEQILEYEKIPLPDKKELTAQLKKLAIVKLNGGLATTMGCVGPKSAVEVKEGISFMDLIVKQTVHLNKEYEVDVPLVLMNSFNTTDETRRILHKYEGKSVRILTFEQRKFPRIYEDSLMPMQTEENFDKVCWYPPGHGDFLISLKESGVLDFLLNEGKEFIFLSNIDNLGAVFDPAILNQMISFKKDFIMEVTPKTKADIKGGTLINYKGEISLLEAAQVPKKNLNEFYSIKKFKFFNTNNIWLSLKTIKNILEKGEPQLDVIINKKTVGEHKKIIQLETAIGSAICYFQNAEGIIVPRTRFLPVKSCSDLFLIQSELYKVHKGLLIMNPLRLFPSVPIVKLGDSFKRIPEYTIRFANIPDITQLDHLTVCGDVYFGHGVKLSGTVIIVATNGCRIDIPAGADICDKVISGTFRVMDH